MTQPPSIRASDEERQRVVDQLGEHHVAGRLDQDEFDERMRSAYTAKTLGDLAALMDDLPHATPEAKPAPRPTEGHRSRTTAMRGAFASWASTAVLVLVIWLATSVATGHMTYFWPFWVVGPWGAVLLFRAVDGLVKGPGEGGQGG
jgi:hypothetical protein